MRLPASVLLFLSCTLLLCLQAPAAVTADELAAYFGIDSWHTVVDMPDGKYALEIVEFVDGAVTNRVLSTKKDRTMAGGTLSVMAGPEGSKYKFAIMFSDGGTFRAVTEADRFTQSSNPGLPTKITEGDFVLIGEPKTHESEGRSDPHDLHSYARGYLLRIHRP